MRMLQRVAKTNKSEMPSGYLEDASEVSKQGRPASLSICMCVHCFSRIAEQYIHLLVQLAGLTASN